jgi:hypothetical protein
MDLCQFRHLEQLGFLGLYRVGTPGVRLAKLKRVDSDPTSSPETATFGAGLEG